MNFLKRHSLFEISLITAVLGMHLYAAFSDAYNFASTWFSRDAAFYYFKVAQNITEGLGSTFDGINPTNGYHPLWMVICIPIFALARFDLILPLRVLVMVMAGFQAVTSVLIYRFVKNNLSHAVALLAAVFWAFDPQIHYLVYEFGLETPLAVFAIVLFIYKLSQFEKEWRRKPMSTGRLVLLGSLAVIVMFSRLDLVFLAILGGIWIIFRGKPIRFFLPLDILIVFASMTFSVAMRTGIDSYNNSYSSSALAAVLLSLPIKIALLYFFGAYQHPRINSVWKTIYKTVLALSISTVVVAILYMLVARLGFGKEFPRGAFLLDWGICAILTLALRMAAYWAGSKNIKANPNTISPLLELRTDWKKWLSEGAVYYGILGGALALYMLFNKIMFGTSSPVSGQIKRWWGTMTNTVYEPPASDWVSFFGLSYHGAFNVWQPASNLLLFLADIIRPLYRGSNAGDERYYIAMLIFAAATLILLAANTRRVLSKVTNMALIPLGVGCGIQLLSYSATAYGGAKEWYWAGQMILVVLAGGLTIDLILRPLQKIKVARITFELASVFLGIFLAIQFGDFVRTVMRYNYFPKDRPYMEVLPFLEQNTSPGSIIGMTGGGNVGYFIHDRTIVNMDGLINSNDYFHALQNKEAPAYLYQHGVQVIFANAQLLTVPPYYGQFAPYLERYNSYGGKGLLFLLEKPKY